MKIHLSMYGGIYGEMSLEPIDTESKAPELSPVIQGIVASPEIAPYTAKEGEPYTYQPRKAIRARMDMEIFVLDVSFVDGTTSKYAISELELDEVPGLRGLIEELRSICKPTGSQP